MTAQPDNAAPTPGGQEVVAWDHHITFINGAKGVVLSRSREHPYADDERTNYRNASVVSIPLVAAPPAPETAESAAPQGVANDLKRLIGKEVNYPGTPRSAAWVAEVFAKIDELAQAGQAAPAGEVASELVSFYRKAVIEAFTTGGAEEIETMQKEQVRLIAALATPATEPAAPGYVSVEAALEALDSVEEPAWHGYECPNTWQDGKWACIDALRALSPASTVQPAQQEGRGNADQA